MHRAAVPFVAWWLACFWLWFLLVGEWSRIELVAGACAATLSATFAVRVRALSPQRLAVPLRCLAAVPSALAMVLVDYAIVVATLPRSLVRRRVVRGRFVVRKLGSSQKGVPLATVLASFSPNAYVVDVDHERGEVLLHDLVPLRKSEEPI